MQGEEDGGGEDGGGRGQTGLYEQGHTSQCLLSSRLSAKIRLSSRLARSSSLKKLSIACFT